MALIVGTRCSDGIILAADRRSVAKYERGPETTKLSRLNSGVVLAGAGDIAVLHETKILVERKVEEAQSQSPEIRIFDIVEITASVVNELVNLYQDKVEEPFGFALAGLENIIRGRAKLYTIFGGGFLDVPWICLGSGSPYARPLIELLLADGNLHVNEATKIISAIFAVVANVQITVGGGIDVCQVSDDKISGNIFHMEEANLDSLRKMILDSILA